MEFFGIACVVLAGGIAYFLSEELPDILKRRDKAKLDIEQEHTRQKELELSTAQTNRETAAINAAPPRRSGPIDV